MSQSCKRKKTTVYVLKGLFNLFSWDILFVFPVQAQNSSLAGLPVSSASPSLRFSAATVAAAAASGTMMMVDPLRQQQQQQQQGAVLHPAFSGGPIPGGLVAEKLGQCLTLWCFAVKSEGLRGDENVQTRNFYRKLNFHVSIPC